MSTGWGAGWPSCPTSDVVTVRCGANGLRLPVRRQLAPLVAGLVLDLEAARREPFRADWSWGFACRAIAGTTSPSNHSRATAIDLDAPENPHLTATEHRAAHPLRKRFPDGRLLRSTMPDDVEEIARRWGFRWGGTYQKPDPMHFETALTPAEALELAEDLRAFFAATQEGPMELTGQQAKDLAEVLRLVRGMNHQIVVPGVGLQAVLAEVRKQPAGTPVDVAALAAQIADALDDDLAAAVADVLAARLTG